MKELLEAFWKERARWVKDELSFDYIKLLNLPRASYVSTLSRPTPDGAPDPEGKRDFARRLLIYFMDEMPFLGSFVFGQLYHPDLYTEEEAREVYQAFLRYDDRFRPKFGERDTLRIMRERSEELLMRFPKLTPATNVPALKVTRFWHPYRVPGLDPGLSHAGPNITTAFYGEGRLWFYSHFEQAGTKKPYDERPYYVFSVDLKTFETETIVCPGNPVPPETRTPWAENNPVLVTPEAVFVMHATQLSCYDRRARTWSFYPELLNLFAQPSLIGNRVYLRSDNSRRPDGGRLMGEVTELNVATGAITLIASDRRQPPESPLDTWPYCELTLQSAPEGRIHFRGTPRDGALRTRYAAYDPAAREWSPLDEPQWRKAAPPPPEEWKVLGRSSASGPFSLTRGKVKIPFVCELPAEDCQLLARNGPFPALEVIERLMPGNSVVPYYRTVPEGLIMANIGWHPGFWFIPNADLEAAARKMEPASVAGPKGDLSKQSPDDPGLSPR